MRCVGKRPVYLTALPFLAVTNIWGYKTTSFNSLLVASIVSGSTASAGDAIVPAVVADPLFVHERETLMVIFHTRHSYGFFFGLCGSVLRLAHGMSMDRFCFLCHLGSGHLDLT